MNSNIKVQEDIVNYQQYKKLVEHISRVIVGDKGSTLKTLLMREEIIGKTKKTNIGQTIFAKAKNC
jgi:hypothetical protein